MKAIIFFCSLLFAFINLSAQSLYMPLNIQKAYKQGTRSYNGKPGPKYWINNNADYRIYVHFDPASRVVSGKEEIRYQNNSPDTLRNFVFRLYQDIYKKGNFRDFIIDKSVINSGVEIKELSVNNSNIDLSKDNHRITRRGTNLILSLPDSLLPQAEAVFNIKWQFVLPNRSQIRMGAYPDSSFFISLWYPQIAVYDDIDGWDKYSYTGNQEFYNDFNNFDVEITVPDSFLVWATGVLQNPEELLQEKYLKRYYEAQQSDSIIHIISAEDYSEGKVCKNKGEHSWHFAAEYVPDFAFAVGYRFLWDGTNLKLDNGKKNVFISAAYLEKSKDFADVAKIARQTIKYLSDELPGSTYPYPEMTVFNGRGGMEYPMMVNDGSTSKWASTVHLTSHEITHTYFPFYMGTNERKYAWMDEGWAQMLPFALQNRLAPGYDPVSRTCGDYQKVAGTEMEVPMMVSSIVIGGNVFRPTYRNASYNRPAMAYEYLQDLLGEKLFKKALKEYIVRWHGKHPIPYDFFFTFDNVAGEDLGWYWKPWFFEAGYPDLSIKTVETSNKGVSVVIKKLGTIPIPAKVKITYADSLQDSLYQTAKIWENGNNKYTFNFKNGKKSIEKVELGSNRIPDANYENNIWKKGQ